MTVAYKRTPSSPGSKVRTVGGVRDAQDIIDEAIRQGWVFEKRSHHWRLVPPNGGVPVGIAGSPSNPHRRKVIISQMRKSGFIWHENDQKKERPVVEALPELTWLPVPKCSAFEFCNGGVVREVVTGKLITPAENGNVVLCDDHGFRRDYSPRALCRAAFNAPPNKKLAEVVRKETAMTAAHYVVDEEFGGSREQDDAQRDFEKVTPVSPDEHWELVLIEGVEEGYEVNEMGEVLTPPRGKSGTRKKLTHLMWPSGTRVVLRLVNMGPQQKFMLNEIVLEAFEARPAPHWVPEHIDGNLNNCARSNLRWVEGAPQLKSKEPVVNPSAESIVDTAAQEAARLEAVRAEGVRELKEGSWPLPAEAFHLDYPNGSSREGRLYPYPGNDPELAEAMANVVHPHSFVSPISLIPTDIGAQAVGVQNPDPRSISIASLNLKVRSYNILHREGILSVGDLMRRTEAEISELRNAGEVVVEDIRNRLNDLGLRMSPGTPTPIAATASDITSYHVHEHVPSGLILKVYGDGRVEQPTIKAHQMAILTQLLAAAADL